MTDLPPSRSALNVAFVEGQRVKAMKALSRLSTYAKEAGDNALLYAANRAWNELYSAAPVQSIQQGK